MKEKWLTLDKISYDLFSAWNQMVVDNNTTALDYDNKHICWIEGKKEGYCYKYDESESTENSIIIHVPYNRSFSLTVGFKEINNYTFLHQIELLLMSGDLNKEQLIYDDSDLTVTVQKEFMMNYVPESESLLQGKGDIFLVIKVKDIFC
jgi:hypothetical protein